MEELVLEDEAECPVIAKSRVLGALNRPMNPDWLMAFGLVWGVAGFLKTDYWWVIGGSLLFLIAVLSLPGIDPFRHERDGGGGHEAGDGTEKPRAPLV